MASPTVTGAAGRVRALVAEQVAAVRAAIDGPPTPESTRGLTFVRGEQVIHLPSGQIGVIVRGKRTARLDRAPRPFGDGVV